MESAQHPLLERIASTIRRYSMLRDHDSVLAALSGGPDSMCLAHALLALGYDVEVAHMDHQTRDGRSAEDAQFVREWAERHGVRAHLHSRPVMREANEAGRSFEEYARRVRYDFLNTTARRRGCRAIATGHHADDQAETVLMRVLRGSSPRGLAGILPIRDEGPVPVVRPLIECRREEILAYLSDRSIEHCHDQSNEDVRYTRNRVRRELLPLLRAEFNPKVDDALWRLAEVQRVESDLLNAQAADFLSRCLASPDMVARAPFVRGPLALQRRAMVIWAQQQGADPPFDLIDGAVEFIREAQTGQAYDLGDAYYLRSGRGGVELLHRRELESNTYDAIVIRLPVPGELSAFGARWTVRLLDSPPPGLLEVYCNATRQVFDADALGDDLRLRRRRPGDRFTPLGMEGTKKLNDYYAERGLTPRQRKQAVLLVSGDRIAWVVGHAPAAFAAVTQETTRLLEVEAAHEG